MILEHLFVTKTANINSKNFPVYKFY